MPGAVLIRPVRFDAPARAGTGGQRADHLHAPASAWLRAGASGDRHSTRHRAWLRLPVGRRAHCRDVDGMHGTRRQRGGRVVRETLSVGDVEPLEPDELERLASAAYLSGRRDEGYEKWAAAHKAYTAQGDVARAARCAVWIAFGLMNRGELARGGGWVERAQR